MMGGYLWQSIELLLILVAPFVMFAVAIHWFEKVTQHRLAERFGWRSVLWTGWLGTPIHEMSHAIFCRVFGHRITDMALFEPDRESGRLGYVRHSYTPGNRYQELGNFFIGVAPLLGGSLVLMVLLGMFYPRAIQLALDVTRNDALQGWDRWREVLTSVSGEVLQPGNWFSLRFWLFLYLVLSVGGHMAPSPSDYQGALRGGVWLGAILLILTLLLAAFGVTSRQMTGGMLACLGPLFSVLAFAVVMCGVSTVVVVGVTAFFPRRFEVQ